MRIEVNADVLRIANLYCTREGSHRPLNQRMVTATEYILLDPDPDGGLWVISTDCAALCVQYDTDGRVDRPYTIAVSDDLAKHLAGDTTRDRIVIIKDETLRVLSNGTPVYRAHVAPGEIVRNAEIHDAVGATWPGERQYTITYPNWKKLLPTKEAIAEMDIGFTGQVSARYLSLIGRMYDEWNEHRDAMIMSRPAKYDSTHLSDMIVQFPWRPDMLLIIAPMMGCKPEEVRMNAGRVASLARQQSDEDDDL